MSGIAVYRRVSTVQQDTEAQARAIDEWLAARGWTDVTIYEDHGISGTKATRPAFVRLCDDVRNKRIGKVIVYRLDRLSRHAVTSMQLLLEWMQTDVEFYSVSQPILQLGKDAPFRLVTVALLAEFAQMEREAIVARVKSGMAAARARGVRLGKPHKLTPAEIAAARAQRAAGAQLADLATAYKVSQTTMSRALRGVAGYESVRAVHDSAVGGG